MNEYGTPLVSPVIDADDAVLPDMVVWIFPGVRVITYPVSGEPPVDAGGFHVITTLPFPGVVVRIVGALGVVHGVTDDEDALGPDPALFVATTEKVYAVPFVRPDITALVPDVDVTAPPGEVVTV
jgi:hypothetical protein